MNITHVGIDLAKTVFQVHAVDETGKTVVRRQLKRSQLLAYFAQLPACQVGMESCGGAHHWARELSALGHEAKLMAPQFVAPYRKGGKNDGNDAQAICEALGRPTMHFVAVKSAEQQAVLVVHRARELLVRERTGLVNQVRGLLAEFGIVVAVGVAALRRRLPEVLEDGDNALPALVREVLGELQERLLDIETRVGHYDRRIAALAKEMEAAKRLMAVEGIGPLTATALVASVGDARVFGNARQFAAWLGLVPRQYSSGGKTRLGRITKRGDVYLRTLLIHGARALMRDLEGREDAKSRWVRAVHERRGFHKAAVALAAKNARIVWALLARGAEYRVA